MSIISRTGDLFYAYRFIKLLVTPWEKTEAFKFEIIDDEGKVLKKTRELKTSDEKAAYTVFHRLVFNIKRLLNKLPFGKTKLASWATALFLIKEETGMSEEEIIKVLKKILIKVIALNNSKIFFDNILYFFIRDLLNFKIDKICFFEKFIYLCSCPGLLISIPIEFLFKDLKFFHVDFPAC